MSSDIRVEKYVNRRQKMTRYLDLVNNMARNEERLLQKAKTKNSKVIPLLHLLTKQLTFCQQLKQITDREMDLNQSSLIARVQISINNSS